MSLTTICEQYDSDPEKCIRELMAHEQEIFLLADKTRSRTEGSFLSDMENLKFIGSVVSVAGQEDPNAPANQLIPILRKTFEKIAENISHPLYDYARLHLLRYKVYEALDWGDAIHLTPRFARNREAFERIMRHTAEAVGEKISQQEQTYDDIRRDFLHKIKEEHLSVDIHIPHPYAGTACYRGETALSPRESPRLSAGIYGPLAAEVTLRLHRMKPRQLSMALEDAMSPDKFKPDQILATFHESGIYVDPSGKEWTIASLLALNPMERAIVANVAQRYDGFKKERGGGLHSGYIYEPEKGHTEINTKSVDFLMRSAVRKANGHSPARSSITPGNPGYRDFYTRIANMGLIKPETDSNIHMLPPDKNILYSLYNELGHSLTRIHILRELKSLDKMKLTDQEKLLRKSGLQDILEVNSDECISDIFTQLAMGKNIPDPYLRAYNLLFYGDIDHYTRHAVQQITDDNYRAAQGKSFEAIHEIAMNIAAQSRMTEKETEALKRESKGFQIFRDTAFQSDKAYIFGDVLQCDKNFLRAFLEKNSDLSECDKRYMKYFVENRQDTSPSMQVLCKEALKDIESVQAQRNKGSQPYFQDVLSTMNMAHSIIGSVETLHVERNAILQQFAYANKTVNYLDRQLQKGAEIPLAERIYAQKQWVALEKKTVQTIEIADALKNAIQQEMALVQDSKAGSQIHQKWR